MLSKKVDATLGAFWNYEGIDLAARQEADDPAHGALGVPTYNELVFAARRKSLDDGRRSRIRRFLSGAGRGHRLTRDDPATGVDALLQANDDLSEAPEAVVKATPPVFFPETTRSAVRLPGPRSTGRLRALDAQERPRRAAAARSDAVTNEFLPGQGLGESARG